MSKVKQNWIKLSKTEPNLRKLSKISSDSIPSLIYGVLIGLARWPWQCYSSGEEREARVWLITKNTVITRFFVLPVCMESGRNENQNR